MVFLPLPGLSPLTEWVILQLNRWMNFAERSLYTSETEFERTRQAREAQNAFYASLLSILPFLIVGGLCNWGVEFSLGTGWAVSYGYDRLYWRRRLRTPAAETLNLRGF